MAGVLAKLGPQPGYTAPQQEHILWPCNVASWEHWNQVQTQWRAGMGGATGLDYAGVRAYLDEQSLPADDRAHVWACITACERATLHAWAEKAAAKKQPG